MKTFGSLLVALALLSQTTTGQLLTTALPAPTPASHPTPTKDEQLFTALVEQVGAAISKPDLKALGELMTPDYTHYDPSGGTGHKAEELAYIATWPSTSVQLVGPVQVSRTGDMAVTVSRSLYTFTEQDKTTHRTIQHMIAWRLHNGKWQMAIIQSKEVTG